MKARRTHAVVLVLGLCIATACQPQTTSAPPTAAEINTEQHNTLGPELLDALVCATSLKGEIEAEPNTREEYGIASYSYTLDTTTQSWTIRALDTDGTLIAELTSEIWLESAFIGRAALYLTDADGRDLLTSFGRATMEPGFGWRIDTERRVGDQRIHLRAVMTSEPAANRLTLTTPGSEQTLNILEADGQQTVEREQITQWAQDQGVQDALEGRWDQIKARMLEEETLRLQMFAHLAWCSLDDQGKDKAKLAASGIKTTENTQENSSEMTTRTSALTCAEEEWARETTQNLTSTLDLLSTHSGKLALGGPASYLIDNSGDLGFKLTLDAGEYGKVTLTKADVNTIRDYVKGVVLGGAVAVAVANPVGVALAGASAATYIGARVVNAFGEDALRSYLESRNRERERPPPSTPSDTTKTWKGRSGSSGDPYLTTHDGLSYGFQAQGEFWLVRSTQGARFHIQARQIPRESGPCASSISVNSAFVFAIGPHRIETRAEDRDSVWVDGVRTTEQMITLPAGGELLRESGALVLRSPQGDIARVTRLRSSLHLKLELASSRMGAVEGTLGNFDGTMDNDVISEDGTLLSEPFLETDLYGDFADHWRITNTAQSLFTYNDGEGPELWNRPGEPNSPWSLQRIPPDAREEAAAACRDAGVENETVLAQCAIDLYCINDEEGLADMHAQRGSPEAMAHVASANPIPVYLSDWLAFGGSTQDSWDIDEDGFEVEHTANANSAAWVSPYSIFGVEMRVMIDIPDQQGPGSVGFVIGLQPESTTLLDAIVAVWHKESDNGSPAGMTVARAQIAWDDEALSTQESSENYQVLTYSEGDEFGWSGPLRRTFTIKQDNDFLNIDASGSGEWRVDAASFGEQFTPGSFGFYVNDLSGVRLTSLTTKAITTNAWRSACVLKAARYASELNTFHKVLCPPGCEASYVWGTDLYTGDSSICSAAAHTGAITLEEGGPVLIEMFPGSTDYVGTERNGVRSRDWPGYNVSFRVRDL